MKVRSRKSPGSLLVGLRRAFWVTGGDAGRFFLESACLRSSHRQMLLQSAVITSFYLPLSSAPIKFQIKARVPPPTKLPEGACLFSSPSIPSIKPFALLLSLFSSLFLSPFLMPQKTKQKHSPGVFAA